MGNSGTGGRISECHLTEYAHKSPGTGFVIHTFPVPGVASVADLAVFGIPPQVIFSFFWKSFSLQSNGAIAIWPGDYLSVCLYDNILIYFCHSES